MKRFRLRFLVQEFDLQGPEVTFGRSPECNVTLDDPLVSRRHARLRLIGEHAWLADLSSRNGVKLNGMPIDGETQVGNGDRIRIGTQELMLVVEDRPAKRQRTTGYMVVCEGCGRAYPEGARTCPHCGVGAASDESTLSGNDAPAQPWTLQLLGQVIGRAIDSRRFAEAERTLTRAAADIDARLDAGADVAQDQLSLFAKLAMRLAAHAGDGEWVGWAVQSHRKLSRLLPAEVLDAVELLDLGVNTEARELLAEHARWWRGSELSGHEDLLDRLERLVKNAS